MIEATDDHGVPDVPASADGSMIDALRIFCASEARGLSDRRLPLGGYIARPIAATAATS